MALNLSTPWALYYQKIAILFSGDDDVTVTYDDDEKLVKLIVSGQKKAKAIAQIMPRTRDFGGVTVTTNVLCEEDKDEDTWRVLVDAFRDNGAVSRIETKKDPCGNPITYVVFEPEIVQYFSDNIGDIDGKTTTIYEEIARDILGETTKGAFYCTEEDFE